MAPLVLSLGSTNASADALLMAVAAGSSCAMLLPTHQSTVITMSRTRFKPSSFMKVGAVLSVAAAVSASLVITWLWN
jgi:di/tricarboxylate transporter